MNDGLKAGSGRSTKVANSGTLGYTKGSAERIVVGFKAGTFKTDATNFVVITDATNIGAGGTFTLQVLQHRQLRPGVFVFAQAFPTDRSAAGYTTTVNSSPFSDVYGGFLSVTVTNSSGGALAERVSVVVMLMSAGV